MNNRLTLSPVVAGCMKWGSWGAAFSTDQYQAAAEACLAAGITTFDHADIYGDYSTEADFGNMLQASPSLRQQMQIITKFGIKMPVASRPSFRIKSYDTSREYILHCAELSLQNLHTDYLDVLLIHRPSPLMHPEEIAEAFSQLKKQGKVLHFGVSNFTPSQMALLHTYFPVEINQLEVSLLQMETLHNGQLDYCLQGKIIPMAWGPLGSGRLFAPDEKDEQVIRIRKTATALAEKYRVSLESILLAFLHRHPAGIIPVLGTSKPERLLEAMQTSSLQLEAEEWFMLWEASAGRQVP